MNNSEVYAVLRTQLPGLSEIPPPPMPVAMPAHEAKPYRDPYLYVQAVPHEWIETAKIIKNDPRLAFDFLIMLTAADYVLPMGNVQPRFDVIYHFYSFQHKHKLFVKVSLPRDNPLIPSVISLWPAADWQEREVYDMFGINFEGHPNCTRILMWDGFPGWPLRKDFVHVPDRYDD